MGSRSKHPHQPAVFPVSTLQHGRSPRVQTLPPRCGKSRKYRRIKTKRPRLQIPKTGP